MKTLRDYHIAMNAIRQKISDHIPLNEEDRRFIAAYGIYTVEESIIPPDNILIEALKNHGVRDLPCFEWYIWEVLERKDTDPEIYPLFRVFLHCNSKMNDVPSDKLSDINFCLYRHLQPKELKNFTDRSFKFTALCQPSIIQKAMIKDDFPFYEGYFAQHKKELWQLFCKHITSPAYNISTMSIFFESEKVDKMLKEYVINNPEEWIQLLEKVIASYNTSKSNIHKVSNVLSHKVFDYGFPKTQCAFWLNFSRSHESSIGSVNINASQYIFQEESMVEWIKECVSPYWVIDFFLSVKPENFNSGPLRNRQCAGLYAAYHQKMTEHIQDDGFLESFNFYATMESMGVPLNNALEKFLETTHNEIELFI